MLKPKSNFIIVHVGGGKMKCRLIAVPCDPELAAQRRRSRRENSKATPSQRAITRDGWHILLTNLSEECSSEELFEIYKLRWNIEVRFKAWKQALNMNQCFKRRSNFNHQECLIYAALIFQLITLYTAAVSMNNWN